MSDNIIIMPTSLSVLAQQLHEDVAATISIHAQWVESMLRLAGHLREARDRFPSDNAFGVWLAQEEIGLGPDDRACLIKMGNEPEVFRGVLIEQTEALHADTLWRKYESRFRKLPKPVDQGRVIAETDATVSTMPLEPESIVPEAEKPQGQLETGKAKHAIVSSGMKAARDLNRANLVKQLGLSEDDYRAFMEAYPGNRQKVLRKELGKLQRKRAIELFHHGLKIVRDGKAPTLSNTWDFDARVFVPDVPEAVCKYWQFKQIAERFSRLAAINAKAIELTTNSASLQEIHQQLTHLWQHGDELPAKPAPAPITVPETDSKARIKHTVTYCGETIWPNASLEHVTYEDLNMGWHIADHWLKHLEVATPKKPNEILVQVMHLIQDLRAASSLDGVTEVMMQCISAYAKRNQRVAKADLSDSIPPGRPR